MELIPGIRIAVRALIVENQAVLVQRKAYEDGRERHCLPGGAPELGETVTEGLIRECQEEIGCKVEVVNLAYVADYFKPRETDPPTHRQQVEMLFHCRLPKGYTPQNGPHPDKHQTDVLWLPVSELSQKSFTPSGLRSVIGQNIPDQPVYLGLIE